MASNFIIGFHCSNPPFSSSSSSSSNLLLSKSLPLKFHSRCSSSSRKFAVSESAEGRVNEEEFLISSSSGSSSSARTQLDLLEQLSSGSQLVDGYESDGSYGKTTIRDQLAQLFRDRDDDFSVPLGKNLKKVSAKFLTISQKRNIKRQAYLNEVSQRNDSVFFATVGAFVILPPIVILGIAILTGYVQLFP
ncbi:uncharacterized protein E5676_scaffold504G00530 [Cucumis melo var. makuwa]|uniref:Uncharacterized protein n=2 Tax=Cucumis melo TaxID=3656 RepID=A0A5D3CDY1_CUCMM|nr:uncharacterized protein E6C27_scaffold207G002140 [Cucumis melo var. makuwa]TYK09418.1 uncharacterized protein E5676_scaffold504G00530 [Cucumis melo var. makuwa]